MRPFFNFLLLLTFSTLFVCAILVTPLIVSATTITGRIVDKDTLGIFNAFVSIVGTPYNSTTDFAGYFVLHDSVTAIHNTYNLKDPLLSQHPSSRTFYGLNGRRIFQGPYRHSDPHSNIIVTSQASTFHSAISLHTFNNSPSTLALSLPRRQHSLQSFTGGVPTIEKRSAASIELRISAEGQLAAHFTFTPSSSPDSFNVGNIPLTSAIDATAPFTDTTLIDTVTLDGVQTFLYISTHAGSTTKYFYDTTGARVELADYYTRRAAEAWYRCGVWSSALCSQLADTALKDTIGPLIIVFSDTIPSSVGAARIVQIIGRNFAYILLGPSSYRGGGIKASLTAPELRSLKNSDFVFSIEDFVSTPPQPPATY